MKENDSLEIQKIIVPDLVLAGVDMSVNGKGLKREGTNNNKHKSQQYENEKNPPIYLSSENYLSTR